MKNIVETIREEAAVSGNSRIALRAGEIQLCYSDLFARVDGLAEYMVSAGVYPGCRVALFCGDCIDYVIASLAVLALQAVVIPVPPTSAEHEMEALLSRIDADLLIFEPALCNYAGKTLPESYFAERQLFFKWLESGDAPPGFFGLNPAFVRFSSGTTGKSKGVLLSHEAILARTAAADEGLTVSENDTILWVLSMSYHFVVSILLFLRRGATINLCYADFPLGLVDAVKSGEGTFIYAAPFHYYTMAASGFFPADGLKNIRMAVSTSMKLQPDVAERFQAKFGIGLTEAYGIIEIGLPFLNEAAIPGSVGKLLPGYELKLVNPDPDGIGEILLRGKGMFEAYVSPWKLREPDSWFDTGDLGRIDDNGNLFIVGRSKSVINFMGMKVFPDEIEGVLNMHPDVTESRVFGTTHPRYGQLPCAEIICSKPIDEAELRAFCLQELSPHKVPKMFTFVDELPRTPSGKISRIHL